jgi:hypothetical protein
MRQRRMKQTSAPEETLDINIFEDMSDKCSGIPKEDCKDECLYDGRVQKCRSRTEGELALMRQRRMKQTSAPEETLDINIFEDM